MSGSGGTTSSRTFGAAHPARRPLSNRGLLGHPALATAAQRRSGGCAAALLYHALAVVPFLILSVHPLSPPPVLASAEIREEELRARVKWLADDARQGRGPGTEGLAVTADYIEEAFRQAGIPPGFPTGSEAEPGHAQAMGYRQLFPMSASTRVGTGTTLIVDRTTLVVGRDFVPMALSDSGRVSGNLVFAGHALVDAGADYDDYAGLEASGAILVALPHGPGDRQVPWSAKVLEARVHGASALFAVVDSLPSLEKAGVELGDGPLTAEPPAPAPPPAGNESLTPSPGPPGPPPKPFLAIYVRRDALTRALGETAAELAEAEKTLAATGKPASRRLGRSAATLRCELRHAVEWEANIVGRLPGAPPLPQDSARALGPLVIGAHYDHLGIVSGQVMNGADDNASGVAALLEAARVLAASPPRTRPIVLVAFAGEEEGLLGSTAFVDHLPFAPADCVAMLCLDTVGRLGDGRLLVLGTGTAQELAGYVQAAALPPLAVAPVAETYVSSDHWSFVRAGIPAVQLFSGANADYHRPTDDWDKIDYPGLARVAKFVVRLAGELADRRDPLTPTAAPGTPGPAGKGEAKPGRGARAWLGTVPDFAHQGAGVLLAGVSPGSPAERAGLAKGDLLVGVAGMTVDSLSDLTAALYEHHAGEEVEVVIQREGREMKIRATLATRP